MKRENEGENETLEQGLQYNAASLAGVMRHEIQGKTKWLTTN